MRVSAIKEEEEKQSKFVQVRIPMQDKRKLPYGLCAGVGISTTAMQPSEAWAAWNDYRKEESKRRKVEKKGKKKAAYQKPTVSVTYKPTAQPKKAEILQAKPALSPVRGAVVGTSVKIPELNKSHISEANSNSFYNRGSNSEKAYLSYANEILSWDISDSKKQSLLNELHKRYGVKLRYEAQHVPWMVAGPANYNAKKLDKGEQVMKASADVAEWFKGVKQSVKASKSQYAEESTVERRRRAQKEEEYFNYGLSAGWYTNPTRLANGLLPIAVEDPQRFVELYEKYDKEHHFRKGTNAAKTYEKIKAGEFKIKKGAEKLYENDSLNAYKKTINAGERVFVKFTTKPKPQLIRAMKSRGWHWNALEGAWGIKPERYDEEYLKGIEERYAKYL